MNIIIFLTNFVKFRTLGVIAVTCSKPSNSDIPMKRC